MKTKLTGIKERVVFVALLALPAMAAVATAAPMMIPGGR